MIRSIHHALNARLFAVVVWPPRWRSRRIVREYRGTPDAALFLHLPFITLAWYYHSGEED